MVAGILLGFLIQYFPSADQVGMILEHYHHYYIHHYIGGYHPNAVSADILLYDAYFIYRFQKYSEWSH